LNAERDISPTEAGLFLMGNYELLTRPVDAEHSTGTLRLIAAESAFYEAQEFQKKNPKFMGGSPAQQAVSRSLNL
jgi:hypothetical protein